MATPIARLGDPHSHGGQIITGSPTRDVDGRPVARLGDRVRCPVHGVNPIVAVPTGSVFTDARPTASVGARTACGATIIAGSPTTVIG